MTDQPAGTTLHLSDVDHLLEAGLIPSSRYAKAMFLVRDGNYWSKWAGRALVAIGLGQLLAGIVFFFAYNWSALPDLAKFGIVEGAILLTALGALVIGIDRTLSQALLISASILVGVLLAVLGQVYQTGADVYELFLAWAVLILPWTIISRSAPLWLIWFVIVELLVSLFTDQYLMTLDLVTVGQASTIVGLVACFALIARELAVKIGCDWLSSHWTRLVLVGVALVTLFGPAAGFTVDYYESRDDFTCLITFVVALIALFYVYKKLLPDYVALVAGIGFADLLFVLVGFRIVDETIGMNFFDDSQFIPAAGLMILWAGLGTGIAAVAMRRLRPPKMRQTI